MRTRSTTSDPVKGKVTTVSTSTSGFTAGDGPKTIVSEDSYEVEGLPSSSRTITDVVNRGFQKRRQDGDIVMSPMQQSNSSLQDGIVSLSVSQKRECLGVFTTDYYAATIGKLRLVPDYYQFDYLGFPRPVPKYAGRTSESGYWINQGTLLPGISYVQESTTVVTAPLSYLLRVNEISIGVGHVDRLNSLALSRAYAKASASAMQGLVTAGEANKTVQTIKNCLYKAYKLISYLRRKQFVEFAEDLLNPRELTKHWLEFRYGIRPIVMDVCNAIEALSQFRADKPKRKTVRASEMQSSQPPTTLVHLKLPGTLLEFPVMVTERVEESSRATVMLEGRTDKGRSDVSQILGIRHVLSAGWELVPYSFIVDWFFNVGTWLQSYEPSASHSVIGACQTDQVSKTRVFVGSRSDVITSTGRSEVSAQVKGLTFTGPSPPPSKQSNLMDDYWYYKTEFVGSFNMRPEQVYGVRAILGDTTTTHACEGGGADISMVRNRVIDPSRPFLPSSKIKLDVAKIADLIAIFGSKLR